MSYMTTAERQSLLSTALTSARTETAFVEALERITTAFGFSHFLLMHAPASDAATLCSLTIATSMPPQFMADFDEGQMLRISPLIARLRESVMPQSWHVLEKRTYPYLEIPPALRALMITHAIPMGISCPISTPDDQHLVFCFSGSRGSLSQSEINEFYMIVLQAVDSFTHINSPLKMVPLPLSARELEVVRWTAQGKTSVEIGQILALSDHTVNAYMTNAMKKLDCVNRTQLVAKAIRLKFIS